MGHFNLPALRNIARLFIVVAGTVFAVPAAATTQTFTGPWDPTNLSNGFSLRATNPGSSAAMVLGEDLSSLTATLTLNNCHSGCGAFYLDNSSVALPYGLVQFDWTVSMNDFTSDGQIAIDGADATINSGFRNQTLYPASVTGSANIDYQGGKFTFFKIGIGAEWTGSTTATVFFSNFSAPTAAVLSLSQPTNVNEPAGWAMLVVAGMVIHRVRRPRRGTDGSTGRRSATVPDHRQGATFLHLDMFFAHQHHPDRRAGARITGRNNIIEGMAAIIALGTAASRRQDVLPLDHHALALGFAPGPINGISVRDGHRCDKTGEK